MDRSLISVILPAYNAESTIERSLDSLLAQTCTDFEVVIINDGSTDRTSEIAQRYVERNPRIRLIHQENRGCCGARNTGLRESKGEWVCFVDADDYVEKEFIEVFHQAATTGRVDCVVTNFAFQFPSGRNITYPFKPPVAVMTGEDALKKTFKILSP